MKKLYTVFTLMVAFFAFTLVGCSGNGTSGSALHFDPPVGSPPPETIEPPENGLPIIDEQPPEFDPPYTEPPIILPPEIEDIEEEEEDDEPSYDCDKDGHKWFEQYDDEYDYTYFVCEECGMIKTDCGLVINGTQLIGVDSDFIDDDGVLINPIFIPAYITSIADNAFVNCNEISSKGIRRGIYFRGDEYQLETLLNEIGNVGNDALFEYLDNDFIGIY